jgi:hypothetical protein
MHPKAPKEKIWHSLPVILSIGEPKAWLYIALPKKQMILLSSEYEVLLKT